MKKVLRSIISLALVMVMLLPGMTPVSAAESGKVVVKKISSGKSAKGEIDYASNKIPAYTFTIKKPGGYITLKINKGNQTSFYVFNHKPTFNEALTGENKLYSVGPEYGVQEGTYKIPMVKGKYYIVPFHVMAYAAQDKVSYNFKYSFTKAAIDEQNYCPAAAKTLKAKKASLICVPRGGEYHYYRWYKIKLTKKQLIRITFDDMKGKPESSSQNFVLYDSSFNELNVIHDSGYKYSSYAKLPKGTYYIRVNTFSLYDKYSYLYKLSWK